MKRIVFQIDDAKFSELSRLASQQHRSIQNLAKMLLLDYFQKSELTDDKLVN